MEEKSKRTAANDDKLKWVSRTKLNKRENNEEERTENGNRTGNWSAKGITNNKLVSKRNRRANGMKENVNG
jgi:hypothetical protein